LANLQKWNEWVTAQYPVLQKDRAENGKKERDGGGGRMGPFGPQFSEMTEFESK